MLTAAIVALIVIVIAMLIGVPVAFSMLAGIAAFVITTGDWTMLTLASHSMVKSLQSFTLLAVPLFLLAGTLMSKSGLTNGLADWAMSMLGRFRGGLAQASLGANFLMSGMSGSSSADTAAISSIFVPQFKRQGYSAGFSSGVVAGPSVIGPLIPPSIVMVIFASLSDLSVGALLLAGVVPAVIMAAMFHVSVGIQAVRRNFPRGERLGWKQFFRTSRHGLIALLMPVIIVGGMFNGAYTATEGAAVAVIYVLIVGVAFYRLRWRGVVTAMMETVAVTGIVMFLYAATAAIAYLLTRSGLLGMIENAFMELGALGSLALWAGVILLLLILGLPLESAPLLVLTVPLVFQPLVSAGNHPLVVGVVMVLVATIGAITPPIGINMFISNKIAGASVMAFTKEIWPFYICLGIGIVLMIAFPVLVTWLPGLVMP